MISSHLSPEPERRLWILLENARAAREQAERKLAGLAVLALVELLYFRLSLWTAPLAAVFLASLAGWCLPLPRWLDLDADKDPDDSLVTPEGLAKYAHGNLILRLDKLLGGGITNTKYYEDLIHELVLVAREVVRKRRLLRLTARVLLAAQALVFWAAWRG